MEAIKCEAAIMAAERGSLTAAASALGYTQSGITRMINSLENELGFALFIRQKRGVKLTENGKIMLPKLRSIVQAQKQANELSASIRGVVQGTLTIGSYFSVSAIWMPAILKQFEERFPKIKVKMLEGGNQEIARWLNEKAVDLCFCAAPDPKTSCDWLPLYQDEMVVWLPKDHPMANQTSYPVAMLSQEKFIHTLPNEDTDQDRLIVAEKLQLNERYTTRDGFTTYNMVEAGLGVSVNQRLISQKWQGAVAEVPLRPAHYVSLGLAAPSFKECSPSAQRFIDCVQEMMPELTVADSQTTGN